MKPIMYIKIIKILTLLKIFKNRNQLVGFGIIFSLKKKKVY